MDICFLFFLAGGDAATVDGGVLFSTSLHLARSLKFDWDWEIGGGIKYFRGSGGKAELWAFCGRQWGYPKGLNRILMGWLHSSTNLMGIMIKRWIRYICISYFYLLFPN